ncbi:LytTR family DNA-binding domain-containing protein [Prolixibacteraceae bacterium Z1-6]|uniref:LytTR family DNA-binding domain-containing protein n=1 Tax=Draconibacterium aestuarii TaxID=2998507 RepID=A0A9X3FAR9_9BACT|nr:LytTR family DNA-binding domain-containing protein [Prolixibacteraceae bacterium Z1-6]
MNCILIEKPHAQNQVKEYLNMVPYFNLVSFCSSVFDAYEILQSRKIDIIFVDTDLQRISGIDFIKSLAHKPLVVFLSDKPELAVESYNINALDFLLKPVTFNRFLKTANKAYDSFSSPIKKEAADKENHEQASNQNKTVLVKTDYKTILIRLNEILYIEGLKDYIKIYTSHKDKPVITLNSLKRLQQNLPSDKFSRIHKSYIVGLDHIDAINKTQVMIHDKHIPIGESYRNIFNEKMEELRI